MVLVSRRVGSAGRRFLCSLRFQRQRCRSRPHYRGCQAAAHTGDWRPAGRIGDRRAAVGSGGCCGVSYDGEVCLTRVGVCVLVFLCVCVCLSVLEDASATLFGCLVKTASLVCSGRTLLGTRVDGVSSVSSRLSLHSTPSHLVSFHLLSRHAMAFPQILFHSVFLCNFLSFHIVSFRFAFASIRFVSSYSWR